MANITINSLPVASTIDGVNDYLPIYTNTGAATQGINRNTLLNLASGPVGLTDSQTLTNKTLTSPTINGATFSGTLSGTYTIGGTPTFPATVVQTTTSQTLTNKTLTSPTINSPTITNATLSSDAISGYTSSTTGSIFGINVNSGVFSSSNIIVNSNITTGNLYTTKIYNPYKFFAYLSSAQNSTSGSSKVLLDTTSFDTSSNFDKSTNHRFTAPVSGYYLFSYSVECGGSTPSGYWQAQLFKNGSVVSVGSQAAPLAYDTSTGTVLLSLIPSDYIELYLTGSSAIALTTGTTTFLSGILMSAT